MHREDLGRCWERGSNVGVEGEILSRGGVFEEKSKARSQFCCDGMYEVQLWFCVCTRDADLYGERERADWRDCGAQASWGR